MVRVLKRVPLDFSWPIKKLWSGYINPHQIHECDECEGLGWSKEYNELSDKWYSNDNYKWKPNPFREGARYNSIAWNNNLEQEDVDALIEADRLFDFTRVPINEEQKEIVRKKVADGENSWLPFNNGYRPTAQEVNEWNLKSFGHDSINRSIVIKARLAKEGKSHLCSKCDGTGENWQHPKAKENYENWVDYEPPTGDGYQLWTTTTEGSPMTPVFDSLEKLCEYCENENVSLFGYETATKEKWFEMLSEDMVYYQDGNKIFV